MAKKYYKSTDPALLALCVQMKAEREELIRLSKEFAAQFDAKPVFQSSLHAVSLGGIKLNNYETRTDTAIWTKPHKESGISRPRAGISKSMIDQLNKLHEDFNKPFEAIKPVSYEPLWSMIGTDWGNLMFGGGMKHFFDEDGKVAYFATGLTLTNCTEILGTEFESAERANDAKK